MSPPSPVDPVMARRARVAQAVRLGRGVGYSCFGLAIVLFVIGYVADFPAVLSGLIVALLLVGCVALPPAIVFGYGLRAAERHEREEAAARQASRQATRRARPGSATPPGAGSPAPSEPPEH